VKHPDSALFQTWWRGLTWAETNRTPPYGQKIDHMGIKAVCHKGFITRNESVALLPGEQKRLSEMSSLFNEIGLPGGSTFNHRVENDQELMHTGGQCHLLWLAFLTEAFIERLNDGIAPGCH
jgi:hypothetical protein